MKGTTEAPSPAAETGLGWPPHFTLKRKRGVVAANLPTPKGKSVIVEKTNEKRT